MASFHKLTFNFNSGEWSPLLAARVDLNKYESACQLLENFIILPYGGVIRRPGTQFMGAAKFADKACRLIGFNFSVTTNFILEFGDKYVRFWTDGIQVYKPISSFSAWVTAHAYVVGERVRAGTPEKVYICKIAHSSGNFATDLAAGKWAPDHPPLEVVTPYLEAHLRQLQYCQINDVMYITHPDYPVHKLTRQADDAWTFAEMAFKWPALLEENAQNININTSATGGNINLHATSPIWEAGDVGSVWQIGHNPSGGGGASFTEVALGAASANSAAIRVRGPWSFTTYGNWSGVIQIFRTIYETGVVEILRTYTSTTDGQRNVAASGNEDKDCSMYINFVTYGSAGSANPYARLEFTNAKVYGLVKITSYGGPQDVGGTVTWGLFSTAATPFWSQSAFSKRQGYPRSVCLHEQRLLFGGTKKKPLGIHGSQIDDYDHFQRGALADQAFLFNIAANESNPIQWMIPQTKLLIGTAGDEWALGAMDDTLALGPGNVDAVRQSNFGSAHLQARIVNEVVLFCQRQGKKLRELTYSFEKDGWVAPDLTLLGAHIAGQGFNEMAFCQQPDSILWAITQEGRLVGLTYERDQQVVGWHRHSTQGTFESVATIYGGNKADEVWFSIKRTVDGQTVRYIERFDPDFRPTFEAEDKPNYWYLDCAKRGVFTEKQQSVVGLGHLEGLEVGVLGDGANQPTRTVEMGRITIQEPAKVVLIGLPYVSKVKPMNINIPTQDGSMQGRKVRIHEMVARIYKSLTAKFSSDDVNWDEIFFRDRDDKMDSSPSVFTGDRRISTGATFNTQQAITIMQDRPFPCCVLAMMLWCNFYGE
jgi:hypothetical protein